jgi:PIN domain nuclease of toxin-antitoxin system
VGSHEVIALLDTHAVIWLATQDPSLGKRSQSLIMTAAREGAVAISAVSFWEIALLVTKGRLQMSLTPDRLRRYLLSNGMEELALTGEIAIQATQLDLHGDPADRFIAASAVEHDATLVTADDRLLKWKHATKRQDARR